MPGELELQLGNVPSGSARLEGAIPDLPATPLAKGGADLAAGDAVRRHAGTLLEREHAALRRGPLEPVDGSCVQTLPHEPDLKRGDAHVAHAVGEAREQGDSSDRRDDTDGQTFLYVRHVEMYRRGPSFF